MPEKFFGLKRRWPALPERMRRFLFVVRLVLVIVAAFRFEGCIARLGERSPVTQNISSIAEVYHFLITAGPREAAPSYTTLIRLSRTTVPLYVNPYNLCSERAYIGELLKSLAAAHPSIVVIDKSFGSDTCPPGDPGTRSLVEGVRALCRARKIVVVGRSINFEQRTTAGDYLLEPALDFAAEKDCDCVRESVYNLHPDLRRVALSFQTNPDMETLALVAARAAADNKGKEAMLDGLLSETYEPYVGFLEGGQFKSSTLPANEFICPIDKSRPLQQACERPNWRACPATQLPAQFPGTKSPIVVIGEDWPGLDRHTSVVGTFPGYVLQANYIESLLDNRVYRPLSSGVNWGMGLVIFGLIESVFFFDVKFDVYRLRLEAPAIATLILIIAAVLMYLSVVNWGLYPDPEIGVLALLGSRMFDLLMKFKKIVKLNPPVKDEVTLATQAK